MGIQKILFLTHLNFGNFSGKEKRLLLGLKEGNSMSVSFDKIKKAFRGFKAGYSQAVDRILFVKAVNINNIKSNTTNIADSLSPKKGLS